MHYFRYSCFLLIFLLCAPPSQAEVDSGWRLVKERSGIKVYHRNVPDSRMTAFKATMRMQATLSSWAAMLDDVPAIASWMHNVQRAKTLETVSSVERYVYTVNDTPPPTQDRDLVVHVIWSQDERTGAITMSMTADPDRLPPVEGLVRIPRMDGYWKIVPAGGGEVEVEYYLHAEPGGDVPPWIANLVARDHPYYTMKNARRLVRAPVYSQAIVPFVKETPLAAAANNSGERGQ